MSHGPSLRAVPFDHHWPGGLSTELLTDAQKQHLAGIASLRQVPARTIIFSAGAPADAIFIISTGIIKSFRELRSGRQRVMAFLYPSDVIGLAEGGKYINSTQALTPATVYQIPIAVLKESFRNDFALQFNFLCKVTHELRQSQRQVIGMARHDASGKLAMFIETLRRNSALRVAAGTSGGDGPIWLPMSRTDIANYLGLTQETLSRTAARFVRDGIVAFPDRHHVRIVDAARLRRLADPL